MTFHSTWTKRNVKYVFGRTLSYSFTFMFKIFSFVWVIKAIQYG